MIDPCPICGKDRILVGRTHNCGARVAAPTKLPKRKAKKQAPMKAKKKQKAKVE